MPREEYSATRYWTFLKMALPLLLALATLRLVAPADWTARANALLLLSALWAYVAALWCPTPLGWCILLVENGAAAVIFFAIFLWLNADMHGVWTSTLALPRQAEVWLAILAALAGVAQLATLKYFLRRRQHFIPPGVPVASHYWLLALMLLFVPALPALLQSIRQ